MLESRTPVGEITILIDVDHCITKIMMSDVSEETVTDFLSDLARFFNWDFTPTERYRHLFIATPQEKKEFYLYNFSEVRAVLMAEYRETIKEIHVTSDELATILKIIISDIHRSILHNKERLVSYEEELRTMRITGRDAVDRGRQEQSLETVNHRIAQLQKQIISDEYLYTYLTTREWDGMCIDCEEPVPIGRIIAAHSLHCVKCAQKKEK